MVRFGKMPDRGIKSLAAEALDLALRDGGVDRSSVQAVWFANSAWGANGGQDCIRGEVALRPAGIEGVPIVNVENACAGGATALHGAWLAIESGAYDCVLAIGVEKLHQRDKLRTFANFLGGLDVEGLPALFERGQELQALSAGDVPPGWYERRPPRRGGSSHQARAPLDQIRALPALLKDVVVITDHYRLDIRALADQAARGWVRSALKGRGGGGRAGRSPFMDLYAVAARRHMQRYGSTERQLAVIASKNHRHGALNPLAQLGRPLTPEEVLADDPVAYPLTRAMCAPVGDGAAAALVCSEQFARSHGAGRAVKIRASVLVSGRSPGDGREGIGARASRMAYERASIGPEAIHVAEVHDATAFGELHQAEALGLCPEGMGGVFAESGATALGGRIPLNTSGGLESRGHPIAASGLAQINEVVTQLRGEAGARQVGGARIGMTQNGGGFLGEEEAAMGIHILEARDR